MQDQIETEPIVKVVLGKAELRLGVDFHVDEAKGVVYLHESETVLALVPSLSLMKDLEAFHSKVKKMGSLNLGPMGLVTDALKQSYKDLTDSLTKMKIKDFVAQTNATTKALAVEEKHTYRSIPKSIGKAKWKNDKLPFHRRR